VEESKHQMEKETCEHLWFITNWIQVSSTQETLTSENRILFRQIHTALSHGSECPVLFYPSQPGTYSGLPQASLFLADKGTETSFFCWCWWYSSLNSEPHTCKAGALPLEPLYQKLLNMPLIVLDTGDMVIEKKINQKYPQKTV
jgi:hypothetical protein